MGVGAQAEGGTVRQVDAGRGFRTHLDGFTGIGHLPGLNLAGQASGVQDLDAALHRGKSGFFFRVPPPQDGAEEQKRKRKK